MEISFFIFGALTPRGNELKIAACAYAATEFSNSELYKAGNDFAIKWLEKKVNEILGDDEK